MESAKTSFIKYASVLLDVAVEGAFDYGIPEPLLDHVVRGTQVQVPLRGKLKTGYVLSVQETTSCARVLPVAQVLSNVPLISEELFTLATWMSKYYCTSLRQVLRIMLPAGVRGEMKAKEQLFVMRNKTRDELVEMCKAIRNRSPVQAAILDVMMTAQKGILLTELLERSEGSRSAVDALVKKGALVVSSVKIDRSPLQNEEYFPTKRRTLTDEQSEALRYIVEPLEQHRFDVHLLYGVTGSGKTEVYLQAIEKALELDKGIIMMVPEVSLTVQTIERFRSRFEGKIAILHHRLSDGERFDEWHRIQRGEARIVIGARSAIFSPMPNLGLIIVDEEHENSYKQETTAPCYHARDVAVMRGKLCQGVVVLGSATPSLESYYNATKGKYRLSVLSKRAQQAALPTVTIVDMKREFEKAKGYTSFSDPLLSAIKRRHEVGEQIILFLNRRGYHTTLLCQSCQQVVECVHCDVALTFHRGDNHLSCHLCGYQMAPPPSACPKCRCGDTMKFRGVGTEQIERALHAILPDVRTLRLDADTTKHKGSQQKLLRAFATGKADVLIGTQMVAKGLHFPQVTLVGILNGDAALQVPDFRAAETAFQLITQVAGRAGRGNLPGEVIIQSSLTENNTILLASQQDYEKFFAEEIAVRELFQYPPFARLVKLTVSGPHQKAVVENAEKLRQELIEHLPPNYHFHPVVPAGHAKVKAKYRFQFLIKAPSLLPFCEYCQRNRHALLLPGALTLSIDVDPTSTFF